MEKLNGVPLPSIPKLLPVLTVLTPLHMRLLRLESGWEEADRAVPARTRTLDGAGGWRWRKASHAPRPARRACVSTRTRMPRTKARASVTSARSLCCPGTLMAARVSSSQRHLGGGAALIATRSNHPRVLLRSQAQPLEQRELAGPEGLRKEGASTQKTKKKRFPRYIAFASDMPSPPCNTHSCTPLRSQVAHVTRSNVFVDDRGRPVGLLEFSNEDDAMRAIRNLDGEELKARTWTHGHTLTDTDGHHTGQTPLGGPPRTPLRNPTN